jgi:DNA-binding transcriptional LysR family regulator
MELWHLRYFVAIGEEENYRRAAQRLHVALARYPKILRDIVKRFNRKLALNCEMFQCGEIRLNQAVQAAGR